MVTTEVLRVTNMDAQTLLGKLNLMKNEIADLRRQFKPKDPTEYQTTKEVAAMFGVSTVTISNWTKSKILKSYKLGNRVYYKRNEVENALTEIKTPTTND